MIGRRSFLLGAAALLGSTAIPKMPTLRPGPYNVLSWDLTVGADRTSVWLVTWGSRTVRAIYPFGQHNELNDDSAVPA